MDQIDLDEVQVAINQKIDLMFLQNSQQNIQVQQQLRKIGIAFDGSPEAIQGLKCFVYGNYSTVIKSLRSILGEYPLEVLDDEILSEPAESLGTSGNSGEILRVLIFLDRLWQEK